MPYCPSRRRLLKLGSLAFSAGPLKVPAWVGDVSTPAISSSEVRTHVPRNSNKGKAPMHISDFFPAQPADLVRELVTVAHFDLNRVKSLVDAHPSLAIAAWDWGFGDWETPLGAASHMGNRPIAEFLIANGATTSLCSAAMMGHLDAVKALVSAQPGIQRIHGPHSISLLAHARMGGEAARLVLEFLQSLGDADSQLPVPLPEKDAATLVGTYMLDLHDSKDVRQIDVDADMKMYANKMYTFPPQLNWTRKGSVTRPLFHLGGSVFYPAGAQAVRIAFTSDASRVAMSIQDGDLTLSALRVLK
jgi:hypothetical protein